jgi:uncharacterized protein (DUF983 family)
VNNVPIPRRSRTGKDAPINNLKFAFSHLLPTLLRGRCPNCTKGDLFKNYFVAHPTCNVCGVRFERDPGSFLVLLGLNYLVAMLFTGIAAAILITAYGLFSGLTPILTGVGLLSLLLGYHPNKALYIWTLWVFGFVYND